MQNRIARTLYFTLQKLRGEPVAEALEDVRRTEFVSQDELRAIQAERQLNQLRFAIKHVPYYQKFLKPFTGLIQQGRSWDEVDEIMTQLPITPRDYVRTNKHEFFADNHQSLQTHLNKTSGSSGSPLTFPCDHKSWAYRHALTFRNMEAFGVEIGEPYIYVFGMHWNRIIKAETKLRDFALNRKRISAYKISREHLSEHVNTIRSSKATHIIGYPSAVTELCLLLQESGSDALRKLKLKAVFLTAEPLLDYQREIIEQATRARCVNQYGSVEGGFTAAECPEGNLHIMSEATWFQVTSNNDVIVTDMMLRAFPMIKYEIGDEAVFSSESCSCGRPHPIIKEVIGRSGDPIRLPNGKVINANLPSYIFKPLSAEGVILKYRFVHRATDKLELYLSVTSNFTDVHLQTVVEETKKAFGENISFDIEIVDEIPHLPNAKHRSYVYVD